MAVQHVELETTFESLVERAHRLEHDAIELRAELDEMAVLLAWRLEHSISPRALQKIWKETREETCEESETRCACSPRAAVKKMRRSEMGRRIIFQA